MLPQLAVNLLGAVLIVVFGFFFVVVSSRITGEIGVSANPISGMTIAALIGTDDDLPADRLDRRRPPGRRALDRGRHRRGRGQRRRHQPGPQDRVPRRRHAAAAADRHHDRRGHLRARHRLDAHPAQQHLHHHRPRAAPGRHARGRAARAPATRSVTDARRADAARRARVGGGARQPADGGRPAGQVPDRPGDARGRVPGGSRASAAGSGRSTAGRSPSSTRPRRRSWRW